MLRGVFFFLRDVVRTYVFLSFLLLLIHCSYFVIANLVLMMLYIYDEVVITFLSPIFSCVVSFLSLCTCFLYIVCNLLFLFHIKMP